MTARDFDRDAPRVHPALCGCAGCQGMVAGGGENPLPGAAGGGAVAAPSHTANALLSGEVWHNDGDGVTLTYTFFDSVPSYYGQGASERSDFTSLTTAMRGVVADALDMIESFTNITFRASASDTAQLGFGQARLPDDVGAWAYYPDTSWSVAGDVWANTTYVRDADTDPGEYAHMTFLHEIGHALGLKHPFEGRATLPEGEDSSAYTVMSYTWPYYAQTYMVYDIAALQALYGVNQGYNSGDTTYTLRPGAGYAIWDAGGTDTFDASAESGHARISLREGDFSTLSQAAPHHIAIAYGAQIENAIAGGGHDTVIGNAAANRLSGGAGDDRLSGGGGDDTLVGGGGADTLSGGAGDDLYVLQGSDRLVDRGGDDTVESPASHTLAADFENLVLTGTANLIGTGNAGANILTGNAGDNTLEGGGGDDFIGSLGGADVLFGNTGDDTVTGGTGDDTLYGGQDSDRVYGNKDADLIYGNKAADTLFGGQGGDVAFGGKADDVVYGNRGADTVFGNVGDDIVYGGQGDDSLFGGGGHDRLYGNVGHDTLFGGAGNDTLHGGGGGDLFTFQDGGQDVILDFAAAAGDRLALGDQTVGAVFETADGVQLNTDNGWLKLVGVSAAEWAASGDTWLL